jgi:hypothetical protein
VIVDTFLDETGTVPGRPARRLVFPSETLKPGIWKENLAEVRSPVAAT